MRGFINYIVAALAGLVMAGVVFSQIQAAATTRQSLDIQATENDYYKALAIAEEVKLYSLRAADRTLKTLLPEILSHGGAVAVGSYSYGTQTIPVSDSGILYWRWCENYVNSGRDFDEPVYCWELDCNSRTINDPMGLIGDGLSTTLQDYMTNYTREFVKKERGYRIEVNVTEPTVTTSSGVDYSSTLRSVVYSRPADVSARLLSTYGVVNSTSTVSAIYEGDLETQVDTLKTWAEGTGDCTEVTRTLTESCLQRGPNTLQCLDETDDYVLLTDGSWGEKVARSSCNNCNYECYRVTTCSATAGSQITVTDKDCVKTVDSDFGPFAVAGEWRSGDTCSSTGDCYSAELINWWLENKGVKLDNCQLT